MYFHNITVAETVFCLPYGPYLRNCLCDLAESRHMGTAMRWLIRNSHIIKGISIPIYMFMYFHYIPIAPAAFCPPFHHISGRPCVIWLKVGLLERPWDG